jgi:glycosyltransferase involved in cell wall biosynthesis
MKILHINKDYGDNGGTEQYLYDLCEILEEKGHQTVVVYGQQSERTWCVPGRSEYFIPGIHEFTRRGDSKAIAACLGIVEKEKPDIINLHITFNPSLVYALGKKQPIIRSIHSPHSYCLRCKLFQPTDMPCTLPLGYHCLWNAYLRRCADPRPWNLIRAWTRCSAEIQSNRNVDEIVVFSNYMKTCLLQNRIRENAVTVLPYFTNTNGSKRPTVDSHENIILYVGRVTKEKGIGYLLRAIKQLSVNYKLVVAGDGWHLRDAKNLAHQLDLADQVEFAGWVSNKDLESYYSRSSMLVIPSTWPEPFGIVGLEAMANSKPVVAFDVGGIADWLDHGKTGFLVEPRNVKEMSARMELLLKNKELAAEMGKNGRERVKKEFNPCDHVKNLISIYRSVKSKGQNVRVH